jgi:hypothetical protein
MNSRQRFLETICHGAPDRVPLFPEGIRDEVLQSWRNQGLPAGAHLADLFHYDEFEELEPDLDPHPALIPVFRREGGLDELRRSLLRGALDPADPRRLPSHWPEKVRRWRDRQGTLFLRVHEGFFLTMGVEGWHSFTESIRLLVDNPGYVHARLAIQASFAARLAERILGEVDVDGAIFHEPIAGNHGPLISPKMYAEFLLASYEPILDVLERFKVPAIILRSYANVRALLPVVADSRINCLWACESDPEAMDYRSIRAEFGPRYLLIGGFDTDVLRQDRPAIRDELRHKVLPLLKGGGYIPLADGRVREGISYENYTYYRNLLKEITFVLK